MKYILCVTLLWGGFTFGTELPPGFIWKSPKRDEMVWAPGSSVADFPHMIATERPEYFKPAPGYAWGASGNPHDFNVKWEPGRIYSASYPHIVASSREGMFVPEPGYKWIDTNSGEERKDPQEDSRRRLYNALHNFNMGDVANVFGVFREIQTVSDQLGRDFHMAWEVAGARINAVKERERVDHGHEHSHSSYNGSARGCRYPRY